MRYFALLPLLLVSPAYAQPAPELPLTIRLGLADDETTIIGSSAFEFAQLVGDELGDLISVDVIVDVRDVLANLQRGGIEMGIVKTTELITALPSMVLFELPFFFADLDATIEIQDSFVGEAMLASLETQGILGLRYWTSAMNRVFSFEEITSPNDLANNALWTTSSTLSHDAATNLGLSFVSSEAGYPSETIPSDAVFELMALGKITAADLSPVAVAKEPDRHPFKHFLDIGYRPSVTILAVNVSFWNTLPYDVQTQLLWLAQKVEGNLNHRAYEADTLAVGELENEGYTRASLPADLESAFGVAAADHWDLSFDETSNAVLLEAKYVRNASAPALPDHDQKWASISIGFVTNREYNPDAVRIEEHFLSEYDNQLRYGSFAVGLDRQTAIGADHHDSYNVYDFAVQEYDQFWQSVGQKLDPEKKMIVFVHGFRNSLLEALLRAGVLAFDIAFDGPVVAFSWPSESRQLRYLGDQTNARRSVDGFVDFIEDVALRGLITKLYILSHSMGSEIVVESIDPLMKMIEKERKPDIEFVFAAPDVDGVMFEQEMKKIADKAKRITLYASDNDIALRCAAMIKGGYERAGQEGEALLVLQDVETIDATALVDEGERRKYETCVPSVGLVSLGFAESDFEHGYVFNDRRVVADLASIIRDDKGAAKRFGLVEQWKAGAKYHRIRP